ncbi:putative cytokinetic ring protein SteA [Nakamurella lactea]|uniref:putative cytokinetic ring protein SteA n=1 Tax=Nakamurella lactea TaxID=459515 RepID=UPI0012B64D1F|nr:putative cytokinetic ring protein SteA [Nakamurella lactea]
MKLLSRQPHALPGVTGVARVARRSDSLIGRVGNGDIVIFDHTDIDRATADALVKAGVTAVVNAAESISGRYPNLGPEILVAAGIPLIDQAGDKVFIRLKDGARIRIDGGTIYVGEEEIASGIELTPESVADLMIEAKSGMSAQLEAFAANAIEYMKRERTLLLDGVGIPNLATEISGKHVLIVAGTADAAAELKSLKKYIRDYRPVLFGVDGGADALMEAGYAPDVIVGNPDRIEDETLRSRGEVVIPADTDGHAPGLERLQDLGIGAVTFPASGTPEDLALLLADEHEAGLMVTVGMHASLAELLDRGRGSTASSFLVRLRVADKVVEASAVSKLYRPKVSWWAVLFLVLAAVVAMAVAVYYSDVSGTYADLARARWNEFADWVKGLF